MQWMRRRYRSELWEITEINVKADKYEPKKRRSRVGAAREEEK